MTEQEIIDAFQVRRRKAMRFGLLPFAVGFAAFALGPKLGPDWFWMVPTGFVLAGAGILVMALLMRCPLCDEPPKAPGGSGRLYLNPDVCRSCGVRLR